MNLLYWLLNNAAVNGAERARERSPIAKKILVIYAFEKI